MGTWVQEQWKQIRGHVKFEIIKWIVLGGIPAMIPFAIHLIQGARHAPQQDLKGSIILGCLIFSSLMLVWVMLRLESRLRTIPVSINPSLPPPLATSPQEIGAKLAALPASPKPVDLRGEISELFFYKENNVMGLPSHTYILMKVQVVNHGPVEATISRTGLQVSIGELCLTCDLVNPIPDLWQIKRRDDRYVNIVDIYTLIDPCLGAKSSDETYPTAIPRTGWLAFKFHSQENIEFPNAEFSLILIDSLGGEHRIRREPQLYVKKGDIVAIPVQPVSKET